MENKSFGRTKALLGEEKFARLQNAKVMIVGLGAVGGYALEALAAPVSDICCWSISIRWRKATSIARFWR